MPWNYRVVKKDGQLAIHGVYYDADGRINGIDMDANAPFGEDLEDLRGRLELMIESLQKPIVDYDEVNGKAEKSE